MELQLFKVFLCIFLYFQGLFYNKCKKVNVYILESKMIIDFKIWNLDWIEIEILKFIQKWVFKKGLENTGLEKTL